MLTDTIFRTCYTCGKVLASHKFHKNQTDCKICRQAYNRRRKYGLTDELFQEMLSKQDSRCEICLDVLDDVRTPNIDHCHQTGKVRGLLCKHCNSMLGYSRDNPLTLIRAEAYLRKYGKK